MKNVLLKLHEKQPIHQLLETTIDGAEDVIVNVTGGLDMTLTEAEEASEIVGQAAGNGVNHLAWYIYR